MQMEAKQVATVTCFISDIISLYYYLCINPLIFGGRNPGNPEFGREVSELWPRNCSTQEIFILFLLLM
jgi:hypothetical protein